MTRTWLPPHLSFGKCVCVNIGGCLYVCMKAGGNSHNMPSHLQPDTSHTHLPPPCPAVQVRVKSQRSGVRGGASRVRITVRFCVLFIGNIMEIPPHVTSDGMDPRHTHTHTALRVVKALAPVWSPRVRQLTGSHTSIPTINPPYHCCQVSVCVGVCWCVCVSENLSWLVCECVPLCVCVYKWTLLFFMCVSVSCGPITFST